MCIYILQHAFNDCSVVGVSNNHITQTHNILKCIFILQHALNGCSMWDCPIIVSLIHIMSLCIFFPLQYAVSDCRIVGFSYNHITQIHNFLMCIFILQQGFSYNNLTQKHNDLMCIFKVRHAVSDWRVLLKSPNRDT